MVAEAAGVMSLGVCVLCGDVSHAWRRRDCRSVSAHTHIKPHQIMTRPLPHTLAKRHSCARRWMHLSRAARGCGSLIALVSTVASHLAAAVAIATTVAVAA